MDGEPEEEAEDEPQDDRPGWPNLLTRLSTFLGLSSWDSPEELDLMLELRWGVGGGPLPSLPIEVFEHVEEEEGDFLMGEPILDCREEGGEFCVDCGGGGKSRLLSGGGGGNSGDWGAATCPPGCHRGFALTAGGDWGGGNLEPPSTELEGVREAPGNWLTICLTREAVGVGEMGAERGRVLEEKLCCLGSVGGG